LRGGLPAWIAGPTALGSPLPWAAPAALTILFGDGGGLRIVAMLVAALVLRRLFSAGFGRLTTATAMWIVGLMVLWSAVSGMVSGGSYATKPDYAEITTSSTDISLIPGVSEPYTVATVDRPAALLNPGEVQDWLRGVLGSAPAGYVRGTATLRFVVDVQGRVDEATVSVLGPRSTPATAYARGLTAVLRYEPAMKDGVAVPMWMTYTVDFAPPAP
jgi:hypothetical protein